MHFLRVCTYFSVAKYSAKRSSISEDVCVCTYVFVLFNLVGLVTQTILTERRQCLSILVFKPRLKKTFPAIILETVYNDICTLLLSLKMLKDNIW